MSVEITLKGQEYWSILADPQCVNGIKDKEPAIILSAMGDTPLRIYATEVDKPLHILELLDERFASKRATKRISVITGMC